MKNNTPITMSTSEIRPDQLMDEQARAYAEDIANLVKQKEQFVEVSCPACGGSRYHTIFEKFGLSYAECEACETVFVNPRPTPTILEKYYKNSKNYWFWNNFIFPASEKTRREKIFAPRARKVIEICSEHGIQKGTLLEVGAGFGTFCEEIWKLKFFDKIIAVEPTPELADTCRKKGLNVIEKPIEKVRLEESSVDVVVSFEVIEHLYSPRDFLTSCTSVLSPGGLLILSCPNIKGFDIIVLRELSDSIDTEHLNYFTPESLSQLVASLGFEILEVTTPGKLDADLVRRKILNREFDVTDQPFLKTVLVENWDEKGQNFQQFLAENKLSSHLWLVGRKK